MSPKAACLSCRARKVKCVLGPAQRCERCTMMGLKDCVFKKVKKRGIGKTLRMREACKRCRTRKRKCDGKRPCITCVEANSTRECEYEIVPAPPGPSDHLQLIWNEPYPSGLSDVSVQGSCAVKEAVPESPARASVPTIAQSGLEEVSSARALVHSIGHNSSPPEPQPHTLNQVTTNSPPRIVLPPFSVLSALISPRIPPEPHVTLLLLGAERFQLSDVALGELDMKFRLRVMCKLNKLGIRFTSEKQQALLRGDTSGTVINPFFIPAAQSLGMHFCGDTDNSPVMIRLQAKHVQKSLELLLGISAGRDWELRAQVALWIAAGSLVMRLNYVTPVYVKKSCEAVGMGGLRFIPTDGRPPEYSEDLHEKLSVLSQIIYFENFWFLTCGGAEPTMTASIEKEFRRNLQEVYPVLFKICPLIMRTQAILLVRDTVDILDIQPTEEVQLEFWRQSCDHLVAHLDHYSRTLLSNLQRFQELGDKGGADIIKSSCVNCLAHLATLCETLYRMEPVQRKLNILCNSALERLSELARDMYAEEYTRLDLLLRLSWETALRVFDARLADATLEHRTRLRHWREAVAEVHLDLVSKIPDAEAPTLASRAHHDQLDGRTEGSRYPNLILPWMQRRYIL